MTSSASSRRRRRPLGPPRTTPSGLELKLAPSSRCPHCGRVTKTVQGVCADCWGSKGGRQFWVRRNQGSPSVLEDFLGADPLTPFILGAAVAVVPAVILAFVWILS